MKTVLVLLGLFLGYYSALAQVITQQGQQQFAQHNQFGQNQTGTINQVQSLGDPNRIYYGTYAITLTNTSNQNLAFLTRAQKDSTWVQKSLAPQESIVISSANTGAQIALKTSNEQPLTYTLNPGNSYQLYWSTPRSIYDVSLLKKNIVKP